MWKAMNNIHYFIGGVRDVLMTEMVLLMWILYSGGKIRKWKIVWKEILEYFFLGHQAFIMTEEIWLSFFSQHCLFAIHATWNLDSLPTFLLSSVYIIGVAPRHQGVGVLHIGENNKIVSIFVVFLRRRLIWTKELLQSSM